MSEYSFVINGNHENSNGNPIPKARKTHRQQHSESARRYHEYLDYVRAEFIDQCYNGKEKFDRQHFSFIGRKPLDTGDLKCRMEIEIEWANHAHGDPENIFGAVADAIFEQDKYLEVESRFNHIPTGAGKVHVRIIVTETRCGIHPRKRKSME